MTKQQNTNKNAIDVKKALKLRFNGASFESIGDIMGVSKQAVHQAIKPLIDMMGGVGELRAFQDHKADVLEGIQRQLAGDLLDGAKRKKATLGNVAYAVKNLNDIIRLERDQATSNVAHAHIAAIKTLEQADDEIAKITGELDSPTRGNSVRYEEDTELQEMEAEIARITGGSDGSISSDGDMDG